MSYLTVVMDCGGSLRRRWYK